MRAQPPNFLFDMALNTSERRALDYGVVSEPLWRQLQRQRVHSGDAAEPKVADQNRKRTAEKEKKRLARVSECGAWLTRLPT